MKKFKNLIDQKVKNTKEFFMGVRREPVDELKPIKFKTTMPDENISLQEWCKHNRVSMLHGKQPVHL